MKRERLHKDFMEAVEYINSYTKPLPADVLLKLYAYYKIAHGNLNNPASKTPLIDAFKANALIQAKNVKRWEAMQAYVDLVDNELRDGSPTNS